LEKLPYTINRESFRPLNAARRLRAGKDIEKIGGPDWQGVNNESLLTSPCRAILIAIGKEEIAACANGYRVYRKPSRLVDLVHYPLRQAKAMRIGYQFMSCYKYCHKRNFRLSVTRFGLEILTFH
jgi:hypothetical protein